MWDLKIIDTDKPLYIAISEAIERDVEKGILTPSEKLPTHRELARIVGVNVSTVTRAYNEAEKQGLITSIVGSGTYITSDLTGNTLIGEADNKGNGIIEMGLVMPLNEIEPDIRPLCKKIMAKKYINSFMGYTAPQGLITHRRTGAKWVKNFGINVNENSILVTSGAQHAINCILTSCFEKGDRIAVDYLTYSGMISAAKCCGIELVGIKLDDEGMVPGDLESALKTSSIKAVYTMACIQNPTNAKMSDKRKKELAIIIRKNDLLLIEDDIYRYLCDDKSFSALSSLVPERSIYIAGIAKAFYAGLRIGFLVAPPLYYNKICQSIVDTVWMAAALNAEIACECINSGLADEIIKLKREEIIKRAAILADKLKDYQYRYEPHSMFAWLKLPDEWNSLKFEKTAHKNGVNIIASDKFAVGIKEPPNYVRLSLTGAASSAEFSRGLNILVRILRYEYDEVVRVR